MRIGKTPGVTIGISLAVADHLSDILDFDPLSKDEQRKNYLKQQIQFKHCYVAIFQNNVVGYVILDTHFFFHLPFISLLVVKGKMRRKGIGTALLKYIIEMCSEQKLFTSANKSNLPMQLLCERLGFIPCGCVEHIDEDDPEIFYCKR